MKAGPSLQAEPVPTDFTIHGAHGPIGLHISTGPVFYTVLMFVVGIATAVGKASVFKFIGDEYTDNIGAVSGVVGLAGFVLPILFGLLVALSGVRTTCFMLMFGATVVSLLFMHFSFRPEALAVGRAKLARKVQAATPAFKETTYSE